VTHSITATLVQKVGYTPDDRET